MSEKKHLSPEIPISKTLTVLIGFPILATLISLLLINRSIITNLGLDFFNTFWIIIICWYLIQIYMLSRLLSSVGWNWSDIGITMSKRKMIFFIGGYLVFAFGLLVFIESALANSVVDTEKLNAISSLTPKTTTARIIFIVMGLVAGLAEEIVYRGFAIRALGSYSLNKWLTVIIAAIPFVFQHGLKSLDQFWWFFSMGILLGVLFIVLRKLTVNIIIHWLIILFAMLSILQVLK